PWEHTMLRRNSQGTLMVGDQPIDALLSSAVCKTPSYLYDLDAIRGAARALRAGFGRSPHLVAYAAKANSAGPILRALFDEGCGADVVSLGELALVQSAGLLPDRIVFSGVAKSDDEIDAALGAGPR